jgi:hypothetical protein
LHWLVLVLACIAFTIVDIGRVESLALVLAVFVGIAIFGFVRSGRLSCIFASIR